MNEWTLLTESNARRFTSVTIEARRCTEPPPDTLGADRWTVVETHATQGLARDGMGLWLRIGGDGISVDGSWEVRIIGETIHPDARAFVA